MNFSFSRAVVWMTVFCAVDQFVHGWGGGPLWKCLSERTKLGLASSVLASYCSCSPAEAAPPRAIDPSDSEIRIVQMGFKDFNEKRFDSAEIEFSQAIKTWDELNRPMQEKVALLTARANVRTDNKEFSKAIEDFSSALSLMSGDGELPSSKARYPEYADAFVGRGLAYEGLAEWNSALEDYDKAIALWGGGRGDGVNPFVLNYRGNVLSRLGRVEDSVADYKAASNLFSAQRDIARYSDSKANLALALYSLGNEEEAVKAMADVIRKNPGYGDMHVAIAAHSWSEGHFIEALNEWAFTCDRISSGCDSYKDSKWVLEVRRWPAPLAKKLSAFLAREIPEKLKGGSGPLAPVSRM